MIVAALVSGNDTVGEIGTLSDQGSISWYTSSFWKWSMRGLSATSPLGCFSRPASTTATISFPFTSAATITVSTTSRIHDGHGKRERAGSRNAMITMSANPLSQTHAKAG